MNPSQLVLKHYRLPFELKPYQIETVDELAPLPRQGHYLDMGLGKTATATMAALYKLLTGRATQCVVIMPPILLDQWAKWLGSLNPAPSVTLYRGTPAKRKEMSFSSTFILVSAQIFKKDYPRFEQHFMHRDVFVLVDEATMLGNVSSDIHQKVHDFGVGREMAVLTGTPAGTIMGCYGIIKFSAPGVYRNLKQFENLHVSERDFFGKPCGYMNLDLLKDNLKTNAKQIIVEDVMPQLADITYQHLPYSLEEKHHKLYVKLANEELLKLPDGGKIDATSESRLTHALGQIILNPDYFSGGVLGKPAGFDLLEETLTELGQGKLVVSMNYRMTFASALEHFAKYDPVSIYGDVSARQKAEAISRFVEGRACRLMFIHPQAAGLGVDGLQHVCNHMMFLEPCSSPTLFHQTVARIKRTGQTKPVFVRIAVAEKTLQPDRFMRLLDNDYLMSKVVRTAGDLRSIIMGDTI